MSSPSPSTKAASPTCRASATSSSRSCAKASTSTARTPAASISTTRRSPPSASRFISRTFPASRASPPPAPYVAAATPSATSTCSSPAPACEEDVVSAAVEYTAAYPPIAELLAKGQNKVSFRLRSGLQIDVRLLPRASFGAALQYFTGSKMHNVTLRQRALKRGYTLSEYALARIDDGTQVAAATEDDIYRALDLDWIPPELRENCGEIEAAAQHTLPRLIEESDIRGDVHMHTVATDGKSTIREMAEAGLARGYEYIAITDHSKNLAMTFGLDDERALEHIRNIREVDADMAGKIRVFAGIEVDILGDGALDLSDEVLAQMDIVIASVHSLFSQPREEMTARILRAIENPYVRILGHPTGRQLLRREPYDLDLARHPANVPQNSASRSSTTPIPTGSISATATSASQKKMAVAWSSTPIHTTSPHSKKCSTASASYVAPG